MKLKISVLIVFGIFVAQVQPLLGDVREEIRKSWSEREERFRTGRIKFEVEATQSPADTKSKRKTRQESVFLFDKERARYVKSGPQYDFESRTWVDETLTIAFDGERCYQFMESDQHKGHSPGYIEQTTLFGESWNYRCLPIIMGFRPLTEKLQGVNPLEWSAEYSQSKIDGFKVLVFDEGRFRFTVAPQMGYALVRQELFSMPRMRQKQLMCRVDINYQKNDEWGVLPEDWKITVFSHSPRTIDEVLQGRITNVSLNTQMQDSDFVIDFPPGSVVMHGPKQAKYVVREDGSFRKVDLQETRTGKTYAEMMVTEAPSVVKIRKKISLWIFVVALVGVGGALFIYQRSR